MVFFTYIANDNDVFTERNSIFMKKVGTQRIYNRKNFLAQDDVHHMLSFKNTIPYFPSLLTVSA